MRAYWCFCFRPARKAFSRQARTTSGKARLGNALQGVYGFVTGPVQQGMVRINQLAASCTLMQARHVSLTHAMMNGSLNIQSQEHESLQS